MLEAGRTGRTINIKKGQFVSPHDIRLAAEKVVSTGNTRIILTVLYALVITPIGLVRRAFGDPLDRRMRDGRDSVWVRRPQAPVDPARYRQQF